MTRPIRGYPAGMFITDVLVVVLSVLGLVITVEKAHLPFDIADRSGLHPVLGGEYGTMPAGTVRPGDTLVAVAGFPVRSSLDIEHIVDGFAIGDSVEFALRDASGIRTHRVPLVPYYSTGYLVIQAGSSAFIFFLGVLVLWKKPERRETAVFHALALCTVLLIMLAQGRHTALPYGIGYALRWVFPATAAFTGATLLHFSLIYPVRKSLHGRGMLTAIYGAAALLGAAAWYTGVRATLPAPPEWVELNHTVSALARIMLLVFAAAAIALFLDSYRRCTEASHRKRILWVFLGSTISIGGFAVFWQIPKLIIGVELIPEEAMLLIVTVFPLFVAISIIRYHLFDIDSLIRRGAISAIVFALLLLLFFGMQRALIGLLGRITDEDAATAMLLSCAVVIVLFHPVHVLTRKLMDRWFFQIRYSYRAAVAVFLDAVMRTVDPLHLARLLTAKVDEFIPVDRAAVLAFDDVSRVPVYLASLGASLRLPEAMPAVSGNPSLPIALPDRVEAGVRINDVDASHFEELGAVLCVPLVTEAGSFHGFLLLGRKRSGFPFSPEDIDLLHTLAVQSARELDRIVLQQHLMSQRAEAQRLEELNRLKSLFVATVSHDLKTPLTSIRMFTELLRGGRMNGSDDVERYLAIIEGECGRLTHLINNVLDVSSIDAGRKRYAAAPCDAAAIVRQALDIMAYQLSMRRFAVEVSVPDEPCMILADESAVLGAVLNLLANAITYSTDERYVSVTAAITPAEVTVSVRDRGVGIAPEHLPHIFEQFFRASDTVVQRAGGTGLGLPIVRHVMEAHGGRVTCDSTPGCGSEFTLHFPSMERACPTS